MAFEVIDPNEIDVGDPLKKELFDKIKNSLDNHEDRIDELETGARKVDVFKFPILNGSAANSFTGITYYVADENFTLTSATITIFEKGVLTGSIEIDVRKSVTDLNGTSFTSVFTTRPKITMASASDYETSSNQVFDNAQISISEGDFIRLDITELPTNGVLGKFIVNVYGEK